MLLHDFAQSHIWNPWHGCHKISDGCRHCYVYRSDFRYNRDSAAITPTANFNLPVLRKRNGDYKIASGSLIYTCFSSDFLLDDADGWRKEAWLMMRERRDLHFFFITKRIHRFLQCIPPDWGEGYPNVTIGCTVENQDRCNYRIPYFLQAPIAHKVIICEPLLEDITLPLLPQIEEISVGGESGRQARVCNFDWILHIRRQCIDMNIPFHFRQTGAQFLKDERLYHIARPNQISQARKAAIDWH